MTVAMDASDKILVTGAAGLVGSSVMELLAAEGFENVVGVGRQDCDLMERDSVFALFDAHRPKHVFHAAARVYGIMGNMKNQGLSFYDNVTINTNVIEACRLSGVTKVTVMGTGAVYPFPSPGLPLTEDMIFSGRPHGSEKSYAHAKRAALAMLEAYQESYDLDWAYIVSCNLFGPRDKFDTNFGHVVPSLVKKFYDAAQDGSDVSVWGDGSAQRDFMYVKDMARAVLAVMRGGNGPVNVGSGSVLRIRDIVEELGRISGLSDRIVWDASKPNGQDYRAYDLQNLTDLGFAPKYSIAEGLQETWDWYARSVQNG